MLLLVVLLVLLMGCCTAVGGCPDVQSIRLYKIVYICILSAAIGGFVGAVLDEIVFRLDIARQILVGWSCC